jgi:hypothetical protein
MNYEEFEKEIELIPLEKGKPTSWGEIRDSSDIFNQKVWVRNGKQIEPEERIS